MRLTVRKNMNSKLCLSCILFACFIFSIGIAGAAAGIDESQLFGSGLDSDDVFDSEHIFQPTEMIYISNSTVTIELNNGTDFSSPDYYFAIDSSVLVLSSGNIISSEQVSGISESEEGRQNGEIISESFIDLIQFSIDQPGKYAVYLSGYFYKPFSNSDLLDLGDEWEEHQLLEPGLDNENQNTPVKVYQERIFIFDAVDLNEITHENEDRGENNGEGIDFGIQIPESELPIAFDIEPKLSLSLSHIISTNNSESATENLIRYAYLFTNDGGIEYFFSNLVFSDYSLLFSEINNEILNDFSEINFIYNIKGNYLRSFIWYPNSDLIHYSGGYSISNTGNNLEDADSSDDSDLTSAPIEILSYKPEVIVKSSNHEFDFNYFFICPEHDSLFSPLSSATPEADEFNIEWQVSANGESLESDEFVSNYDFLNEENELATLIFSHAASFIGFNSLKETLEFDKPVQFEIYPCLIPIENITDENPDSCIDLDDNSDIDLDIDFDVFKSASIPITFISKIQRTPIVLIDNTLTLSPSVSSQPTLSSLQFPNEVAQIFADNNVNLIVESLTAADLQVELQGAPIAIINISFSDLSVKSMVNEALKNGGGVDLTFSVPTTDSFGSPINPSGLVVLHVVEKDGRQTTESLKITHISKAADGFYTVTATTTGFSPFIIASSEVSDSSPVNPSPMPDSANPSESKSSSSVGQAVIRSENAASESFSLPIDIDSKFMPPQIIETVEKIQGYLSLFSILVVLVAGLFVLNYIRRSV